MPLPIIKIKTKLIMLYKGTFKNVEDDIIVLYISTNNTPITSPTYEELRFTDEPVIIQQESNEIFGQIKPLSCTINLFVEKFYPDFYTAGHKSVKVYVDNESKDYTLFVGYLTPYIYTQPWETKGELSLEAVSSISVLEHIEYTFYRGNKGVESWKNILDEVIYKTGIYTEYYISTDVKETDTKYLSLYNIYQDQQNFVDDDDEKSIWSSKDVLVEFCKLFCLTIVEHEGNLLFIDYNAIKSGNNSYNKYVVYSQEETFNTVTLTNNKTITRSLYKSGGQTISINEIYDKVSVNANLYPINKSIFDLSKEDLIPLHPNIPYIEIKLEPYNDSTQNTEPVAFRDYFYGTQKDVIGNYDIYRFYLLKNYKHYFYKSKFNKISDTGYSTGFEDTPVYLNESNISQYTSCTTQDEFFEKFIPFLHSHLGCVVVKHQSWREDGKNRKPESYNFDTYLLFSYGLNGLRISPSAKPEDYDDVKNGAQKGHGYKEEYNYYTTIALYNHYYAASKLHVLESRNIIDLFTTNDYKTFLDISGDVYLMRYPLTFECDGYKSDELIKLNYEDYGPNWWTINKNKISSNLPLFSMFYNGNYDYFTAPYNVDKPIRDMAGPVYSQSDIRGFFHNSHKSYLYKWYSVDKSSVYTESVIKPIGKIIEYNKNYADVFSLTTPMPYWTYNFIAPSWAVLKEFKISATREYDLYIVLEGKEPETDVVYTTDIKNYTNEFSVDVKITTQPANNPLSLSSLLVENSKGEYEILSNLKFYSQSLNQNARPEELLVEKYYNYYNTPKILYSGTFEGYFAPYSKIKENNLNKQLYIDSFEYDCRLNKTQINTTEL